MKPHAKPNHRAAVLAYVAAHPEGVTTGQVARHVGCGKTCAYRHLYRGARQIGTRPGSSNAAVWISAPEGARMQPVGRLWPWVGA